MYALQLLPSLQRASLKNNQWGVEQSPHRVVTDVAMRFIKMALLCAVRFNVLTRTNKTCYTKYKQASSNVTSFRFDTKR